jgi:hypothetical protein
MLGAIWLHKGKIKEEIDKSHALRWAIVIRAGSKKPDIVDVKKI